MSKNRRSFSDTLKADAVRRHLVDKVPVSDLADELNVQPSMIHLWVKQVLEQAEKAFQNSKGPKRKTEDSKDRAGGYQRIDCACHTNVTIAM